MGKQQQNEAFWDEFEARARQLTGTQLWALWRAIYLLAGMRLGEECRALMGGTPLLPADTDTSACRATEQAEGS